MRTINLRQFQRNLSQEVKDLPILVTRDGQPMFTVTPYILVPTSDIVVESNKPVFGSQFNMQTNEKPSLISRIREYFKSR